jgi:hypothetical protein
MKRYTLPLYLFAALLIFSIGRLYQQRKIENLQNSNQLIYKIDTLKNNQTNY